jgi:hypothetical protein
VRVAERQGSVGNDRALEVADLEAIEVRRLRVGHRRLRIDGADEAAIGRDAPCGGHAPYQLAAGKFERFAHWLPPRLSKTAAA